MDKLFQILSEKMEKDVLTEEVKTAIQDEIQLMINEQVKAKTKKEVTAISKKLKEETAKELKEFKEDYTDKLDHYLSYAAGKFFKENKQQMESSYKVELAESIISAVKGVLESYQVELPKVKVDTIAEQKKEIAKLKKQFKDVFGQLKEAKDQNVEYEKAISFNKMTKNLTESQKEDVLELIEGIRFVDVADFERKLNRCIEKLSEKVENVDGEKLEENINNDDSSGLDKVEPKQKIHGTLIPKKRK